MDDGFRAGCIALKIAWEEDTKAVHGLSPSIQEPTTKPVLSLLNGDEKRLDGLAS
jgi:hypothetical protein